MRNSCVVLPCLGLALAIVADAQSPLPVMPLPAHVVRGEGSFVIDGKFGIAFKGYTEPRLDRAKQRFLATLARETGIPLYWTAQYNRPHFVIDTKGPSEPVQQLGEDESYRLAITPKEIRLSAPNPLGILHALQTFLQLVQTSPSGFVVPAVTIDDAPRFAWRGLMIDCSRHFIPIPLLKRNLDAMEAVKLNVFHWHLSDDQGFRAASNKFPLLQEKGSDGLYYTQDQMREVVAYARDRGIRVVPEFDVPGHTISWFVGYPQLASGPGPYRVARTWGVHNPAMDPTRASTYQFLDFFISEMTDIFPDAYFHVGGDEVTGRQWDSNLQIQDFMRSHGLKSNAELQAYFTSRVQQIVANHHKIMEGWDEVLQPNTPKDVVIQSWRGAASLAATARQGNRAILSSGYYLNHGWPASDYFSVDPISGAAAALTQAQQKLIVGGEAAMWTEYVDAEMISARIWPRLAAIAERLWSPQSDRDVSSMYARLSILAQHLTYYGIRPRTTYSAMLQRMGGGGDSEALHILGDTLRPQRNRLPESTSFTPHNRMTDAIPPESETARRFLSLADAIVSGKATPNQWQQARQWLTVWRDNDAKLQPTLQQSALTEELVPVSARLRQIATAGLQALAYLRTGKPAPANWKAQQTTFLEAAERPQAQVISAIAPTVLKLVAAAKE